jgi:hypothetical protein
MEHTRVTEKELGISYKRTPMDVLLSPPEELEEEDAIGSDTSEESSHMSSRTTSTKSVPSLDDRSPNDDSLSFGSLTTPSSRGKRSTRTRRLQILSSLGESTLDHPLSGPELGTDELNSGPFGNPPNIDVQDICTEPVLPPRKFNSRINEPFEAHIPSSMAQTTSTKCIASIQMQTYSVSKAPKASPPNVISRRTSTGSPEEVFAEVAVGPLARQRDMRENSDFIRIAAMEMMMRKNGKLADKMPGRARWALPPRKPFNKVYEIGEGGVPVRWIATTIS